jgi:hypothetical protein
MGAPESSRVVETLWRRLAARSGFREKYAIYAQELQLVALHQEQVGVRIRRWAPPIERIRR